MEASTVQTLDQFNNRLFEYLSIFLSMDFYQNLSRLLVCRCHGSHQFHSEKNLSVQPESPIQLENLDYSLSYLRICPHTPLTNHRLHRTRKLKGHCVLS